jgi:PhzF family phenazine biosynthesis protein
MQTPGTLPIYQVDAFAERLFTGNPAAVVPLEAWLPDALLQDIAAENNLSETVFCVPDGEAWHFRWFTPVAEVDLCGHATLAAAFVISERLRPGSTRVHVHTRRVGDVFVERGGDMLTLDFPAWPPAPAEATPALVEALGGPAPVAVLEARDTLVVYDDPATVRALRPDFARLAQHPKWVIVTAPGGAETPDPDVDFVSRFFDTTVNPPEDPVTGSAHCILAPYWAARLGKATLEARQVSKRGGRLHCRVEGDRVFIGGRAVMYLEGVIRVG